MFNPIKTGEIKDGIYAVKCGMVNMFIVKNGPSFIAIDAGISSGMALSGLKLLNIKPDSITHVFFTHTDYDHKGGVRLFKNAEIYISEEEENLIKRKVPRNFGIMYNKPFKRKYELLKDGQIIDLGLLKVKCILTPGHTVGSMSYLINDKYLFTGDTLRLHNAKVKNFPSFINMNTKLQRESIKKLAKLNSVKIIFTAHHGFSNDFEKAFRNWT